MALVFIDPTTNKDYATEASTTLNKKINGDGLLEIKLFQTENNKKFLNEIGKMWRVSNIEGNGDKREYVIISVSKKTISKKPSVSIVAREKVYDDLANDRIYEKIDGSYTAQNFFDAVFKGSVYDFSLSSNAFSEEWQNAGLGNTRLNVFLNGIDRYGLEFNYLPETKTFLLKDKIFREPAYYLSRKINAKEIEVDEDASNFSTYARGYGNFTEEEGFEQALLIREYIHPIEKVIKQRRHAEPIKDGRIKIEETMDKALKALVDDSLKISISVDFLTTKLRDKNGKSSFVVPKEGDLIMVEDDTINFREKFRILEIKESRNAKHDITKQVVTLGDKSREERYYQSISDAQKYLDDLKRGRIKLGYSVLPQAVKSNTDALKRARTSLEFGLGGITARDPSDPNIMTIFNSRGIGISDNGGYNFKSAITGNGINADAITTGTLIADHIRGGTLSSNNNEVLFELDKGRLSFQKDSSIDFYSKRNKIKYNTEIGKNFISKGFQAIDEELDSHTRKIGVGLGTLDRYYDSLNNLVNDNGNVQCLEYYNLNDNGEIVSSTNYVRLISDVIDISGNKVNIGKDNNGLMYTYDEKSRVIDPTLYNDSDKTALKKIFSPVSSGYGYGVHLGTVKEKFIAFYTKSINGMLTHQVPEDNYSSITTFGKSSKPRFAINGNSGIDYHTLEGVGFAFSEVKNDAFIQIENSFYSLRELVSKLNLKEYSYLNVVGRGPISGTQ